MLRKRVADAPSFLSVENMALLVNVLREHILAVTAVDVQADGIPVKQLLLKVMSEIQRDCSEDMDIHSKNKAAIKIAKDFLLKVLKKRKNIRKEDTAVHQDQTRARAPGDVDIGDPVRHYTEVLQSSFENTGSTCTVLNPSKAGLVSSANQAAAAGYGGGTGGGMDSAADGSYGMDGATDAYSFTVAPAGEKRLVDRYLLVNGAERNWTLHSSRFFFQVDLTSSSADFKNVRKVAATHLVIPSEIHEAISVTSVPKTDFLNRFGLQHPYLILRVDELQSAYRSPSSASQNSFCHFSYDSSHTTETGRRYVNLKPMQNEELSFDTNPLAQISVLTLSLLQPNGQLLNQSKDDYRLFKVDYDKTNSKYMNIRLGRYFDRNEFYRGDRVLITGFAARWFVGPNPGDYYSHPQGGALENFLNRDEGHEIMEIDTATASGYHNSFFIRAPGGFDASTGTFQIDLDSVDSDPARTPTSVLYDLNQNLSFPSSLSAPEAALFEIGRVINLSLQFAVTFKVTEEENAVTV